MDYYANVVIDYLRANRSTFVNTEYCIQLNPGNPDTSRVAWTAMWRKLLGIMWRTAFPQIHLVADC